MIIDLLAVCFLGIGFYWGYNKGIVYAVLSWIGLFLSAIFSLRFAAIFADKLGQMIDLDARIKLVVGFIILFLFLLLAVRLVIYVLDKILKTFSLDNFNRIAGGIMYAFILLFLLSEALWYADKWENLMESQRSKSHVYFLLSPLAPETLKLTASVLPAAGNALSAIDSLSEEARAQISE